MNDNTQQKMQRFLDGSPFAVVGASKNREKYGNKVLRVYRQNDLIVFPVNPKEDEIEGQISYPDLTSVPEKPHGISIVTPPSVTREVVQQAIAMGVQHIWMQPGAEDEESIADAEKNGLNLIANGPCILVKLGYTESA